MKMLLVAEYRQKKLLENYTELLWFFEGFTSYYDDLFLRRPHGLDPTAVAIRLEGTIREAVDSLRGAVGAVRYVPPRGPVCRGALPLPDEG